MQKLILGNKNKIMAVQAVLIIGAFIAHYGFGNEIVAQWSFLIAGIMGIAPILLQAISALQVKVVSIDVLVSIAAIGALFIQNFEESAIVTFLFLFGAWLEEKTLNYTRTSIKELTEMAPEKALVQQEDGSFEEEDVDFVDEGAIILVRTGAKVPVDGTVLTGEGHLNEASITGESVPVSKDEGDEVFAGTILDNGTIQIRADKVGEDTTFGRIIELVEEAQDSKSEAERFIDSFSKWYTPAVLVIGFLTWLLTRNVELAITVLVLGCPGALVIGVPVSNVAGIGNGARNGVLLKGSEVIQDFAKVDTIIFDKTGTLTVGNPEVAEEKFYTNNTETYMSYLAAVESESDHPLAKAVLSHLALIDLPEVDETDVVKGGGILAQVEGRTVAVGNLFLMENQGYAISEEVLLDTQAFEKRGNSIVMTAVDGEIISIMGIRDQIRPGVKEQLEKMKQLGVKNLIVASGDNQGTVDLVARELGLTEARGHMLPEDKSEYVEELQNDGQIVAFVGDGVNDAPSLALADIGIAMGSGTDVAMETSDVVLVNSDFEHLNHSLSLTKATSNNMIQNIVIAIGVVIALVAMLFFTDWMNMSLGMLVHEGSILVVILNAMRLLGHNLK
ncbi:MAG: heavy metal translocating P-type ATPase [Atopococcus tabaci]|uniref:Cd(2+)-exporting ATPase n=1 Tax=Atopococcus tabaci TaxID=269774 RepID=A0AA43UCU2_9LACT|nr:heavy metal translocating P-type ATPase [Atopococcus tabaci]